MLGQTNQWWWEPVRRQVLRFAGTPEDIINRNLWGYGAVNPATYDHDAELRLRLGKVEAAPPTDFKPLVTYISRQSSRRRLTPESHADLVQALEKHSKAKGWELKIVEAEKMSKEEQVDLAARTTVGATSSPARQAKTRATDHARRARQWSDTSAMDAADPAKRCH